MMACWWVFFFDFEFLNIIIIIITPIHYTMIYHLINQIFFCSVLILAQEKNVVFQNRRMGILCGWFDPMIMTTTTMMMMAIDHSDDNDGNFYFFLPLSIDKINFCRKKVCTFKSPFTLFFFSYYRYIEQQEDK